MVEYVKGSDIEFSFVKRKEGLEMGIHDKNGYKGKILLKR